MVTIKRIPLNKLAAYDNFLCNLIRMLTFWELWESISHNTSNFLHKPPCWSCHLHTVKFCNKTPQLSIAKGFRHIFKQRKEVFKNKTQFWCILSNTHYCFYYYVFSAQQLNQVNPTSKLCLRHNCYTSVLRLWHWLLLIWHS
jgi:hypothetical protein